MYFSKVCKLFFLTALFSLHPLMATAIDKIVFSGGAPLDTYQPRVIVPLLTEAFKRNGIEFEAEYLPSLRSLSHSNTGKVDGELHRVYEFHEISDAKYPNLIRIESKLLSIWLVAFAKKDKNIQKWDDLKGYNVAYYRGRKNVEKYLNAVIPPKYIYTVNTDSQAFEMLAADRIDVVISERLAGKQIISNNSKLLHIVEVAKLEETKIYSYINEKHKNLGTQIAQTLEEMKQDGTFSTIVAKHAPSTEN